VDNPGLINSTERVPWAALDAVDQRERKYAPLVAESAAGQKRRRTDAALFKEISASTIFAASRGGESQRWISALADLIDDMFTEHDAGRVWDVILRHAVQYTNADAALLSFPVDANVMQIRNAVGANADTIVGQTFDRQTSIAGQVLDSGQSAYVDMARLKSPIDEVGAFGPMVITPLLGLRAMGTLGVARVHGSAPLTAQDLTTVAEFASLAAVAMHVDEARENREAASISAEQDRLASRLLDSLINRLFKISMVLAALTSSTHDPELSQRLRETAHEMDLLIAGVRTTIYGPKPHK
jgi:signal transduction histidine kinase